MPPCSPPRHSPRKSGHGPGWSPLEPDCRRKRRGYRHRLRPRCSLWYWPDRSCYRRKYRSLGWRYSTPTAAPGFPFPQSHAPVGHDDRATAAFPIAETAPAICSDETQPSTDQWLPQLVEKSTDDFGGTTWANLSEEKKLVQISGGTRSVELCVEIDESREARVRGS